MNQISALPNPLEILFQEYNQGRIESVGFRSFTLHAGESNSYRTLKSALIVPVSGRPSSHLSTNPSLPSEDYSCTDVPTRP